MDESQPLPIVGEGRQGSRHLQSVPHERNAGSKPTRILHGGQSGRPTEEGTWCESQDDDQGSPSDEGEDGQVKPKYGMCEG